MNIGIIGGGIIGLFSAYYLRRSGHHVTVIDQGDLTNGCSWGNAGMIVPSHFIPMAAPGMVAKGVRWMFSSRSPFYLKPRLNAELLKWGYHFYKNATPHHVEQSVPVLKEISLLSKSLYQSLSAEVPFKFGYEERGLLMLYRTAEAEREEIETAAIANDHGIAAQVMSPAQVQAMEPDVEVNVRGGIYFPGDAHLVPQQLIPGLIACLHDRGVEFKTGEVVKDLVTEKSSVKAVVTEKDDYPFDEVIIAAGSWSGGLAKRLGVAMPLEAGKGYSFMQNSTPSIRIPSIFVEARVAVTPMGNSIRFGGTMELAGMNHSVNLNRVKAIVDSIPHYYPRLKIGMPVERNIWHGMRPCSPDGLPYIGRLTSFKNVTMATGHSMMGISLGPATGKLVAEIINKDAASMDLRAFQPERFT